MGSARAIRPTIAGTFSMSISRSALDTDRRMAGMSSTAAWRATSGSDAVAIDTPNMPIGRYMSRNA